jgi:hypothetical protein
LEDKMSQYRWMRSLVAVSTLGAVAATGCFVVDDTDSDDDEDNGGEDSGGSAGSGRGGRGGSAGSATGGSTNGGSTNGGSTNGGSTNGGSSTGGSTSGTDAGGSSSGGAPPMGGSGGGPSGDAVMKFCNELYLGGTEVVPLTIAFAGVEATALSGECTPVVPNACIPIPAGTDPSVVLMDDLGEVIVSGSFPTLTIADGDEILVDATVDDMGTPTDPNDDYPTVLAGPFNAGLVCADTDPLPPDMLETRSAPYSLPFAQDARHALKRSVTREARAALPAYRFGTK